LLYFILEDYSHVTIPGDNAPLHPRAPAQPPLLRVAIAAPDATTDLHALSSPLTDSVNSIDEALIEEVSGLLLARTNTCDTNDDTDTSAAATYHRRPSCLFKGGCGKKKVSFHAEELLAQEYVDELWSDELQAERRAGDVWLQSARDRDRFQRRVECAGLVIAPALLDLAATRHHVDTRRQCRAATLIQAHVRGWLCRSHFSLHYINSCVLLERESESESDDGLDYSTWSQVHSTRHSPTEEAATQGTDDRPVRRHHDRRSISLADAPVINPLAAPRVSPRCGRKQKKKQCPKKRLNKNHREDVPDKHRLDDE
jgi:hypothetical protein